MSTTGQLRQIQQEFMDYVYKRDIESAQHHIKPSTKLSAKDRLNIYQGSVLGNLTQALGDIYPALKQCLGTQFFEAMAHRYIHTYPSRSASLDNYGAQMAEFISGFTPLKDYPYTADLAQLEWHWHRAFHAIDEPGLDMSKLVEAGANENSDSLIFKPFESIYLLHSNYPILDIWELSVAEQSENTAQNTANEIELKETEQFLMIWRTPHYEMRIDLLSACEFATLQQLKKGNSLGTIFDLLGSKYAPEEINQVLSRAVQQGWLADI